LEHKSLCRYDIKADTFTNLSSSGKKGNEAFWSTKTEVFCFEYGEYAITAYDILSLKKRTIVKLTDADSLGYRGAKFYYSIFDAKSNSIWMLQEERNSLLRIFLATGKRERYSWPVPKEKNSHADAEGMSTTSKEIASGSIVVSGCLNLIYTIMSFIILMHWMNM
jgi:hypothetical protein